MIAWKLSVESTANAFVWIFLLSFAMLMQAQSPVSVPQFSTYEGTIDTVNVGSLQVLISIPLYHVQGRGSSSNDTDLKLIYSSVPNFAYTYFHAEVGQSTPYVALNSSTWSLQSSHGYGSQVVTKSTRSICKNRSGSAGDNLYAYVYTFLFIDYRGVVHTFPNASTTHSDCTNVTTTISNMPSDGGIMLITASGNTATVRDAAGIEYQEQNVSTLTNTLVTDTNGNSSSIDSYISGGAAYFKRCYPTGAYLQTPIEPAPAPVLASSGNTPLVSVGCPNASGMVGPSVVSYVDTTGAVQQTVITYKQYQIANTPDCFGNETDAALGCASGGGNAAYYLAPLIDRITMADGSFYAFQYEHDAAGNYSGRISQLTLPTGGAIGYSYGPQNVFPSRDGSINSLTRTTSDGTTQYSRSVLSMDTYSGGSAPLAVQTTITYPDQHQELASFVHSSCNGTNCEGVAGLAGESDYKYGGGYFETARTVYSAAVGSTVMKTVAQCYNGATGPCASQTLSLPITQISATATVDGISSKTVEYMNSSALVSEVDEVDFGATNPTRKTFTQYASLGNNISNRPQSITVTDGSGNPVSKVTYGYDEYSLTGLSLVQTSGLPNHAAVSGARGNRTSQHAWLLQSNTSLDTYWQYDDAGQVRATEDPRTNWIHVQPDTATDLCPNSTTFTTPSSGLPISMSQSCDPNTGLPSSTTDMNGVTTTYTYNAMLQEKEAKATTPSGNVAADTQYGYTVYSGSLSPATMMTTVLATPSPSESSVITVDGQGRKSIATGANGSTVVTSYDNMGRVHSVSNPYVSTSDSTYGVTTYTYDVLGRQILQQQSDGTNLTWCYDKLSGSNCRANASTINTTGAWVDSTDEAGNDAQHSYDGLGRLTGVMEPNSSQIPGIETDYQYDLLNNVLNIKQRGISTEIPRVRTFTYDSLSRLLKATNPENGTICYGQIVSGNCTNGYDNNGNLVAKTDARGITTTYAYDSLNRLISKSYSDGVTPTSLFVYDVNNIAFSATQKYTTSNVVGRLSVFCVNIPHACQSMTAFSYDAMGRVVQTLTSTPSNPTTGAVYPITAAYDLAGNMTDLTYPDGRHIKETWNSAGQLGQPGQTAVQDTGSGQQYVATVAYSPDGSPNVTTLGNGVVQTMTQNKRLQVQSLIASSPLAPFNGQSFLANTYCYTSCATGGTANNGNIWGITDTLKAANSQGFTYDSLNRISSFSLGGALNQQYSIDSFGNMSGVVGSKAATTFDPATNRINNLPCAGSVTPYDAVGNQICDTDQYGGVRQYKFDAESRVGQIATLNNATPFETYGYYADGIRVSKTNANGSSTEYVNFAGQPIAERDQTNVWTDYIYANGKKIARAGSVESRIHLSGTNCSNCGTVYTLFNMLLPSYTIQAGDTLYVTQYAGGSTRGGLQIALSGTNSYLLVNDQNGNSILDDTVQNQWHHRSFTMPQSLAGQSLVSGGPTVNSRTAAGAWNLYFRDITIVQANGTVIPIYKAENPVSLSPVPTGGVTQIAATVEKGLPLAGAAEGAVYTLADHLGSAQLELSVGGWPTWRGQFAPFGAELDTQTTTNHYKFTGKERDSESGLDLMGARYYSSNMGRFMSPDPSGLVYADPSNPQSLNLYSYAQNNPLVNTDPSGYDCVYLNNSGTGIDKDGVDTNSNSGECGDHGGYWVDGTFTSGTVYANNNDVYLRGYDSSGLTDSYTNTVTTNSSSPINTDVFSGPNLFAYLPSQPIPQLALNAMIHSLNHSGQSDKLVNCVIQHESRGESGAKAPGSTATGLMQILKGTAAGVAAQNSGDFGGMSGAQVFSQMKDPGVAIVTGSDLIRMNAGKSGDATRAMEREYGSADPTVNAAFAAEMTGCASKP